MNKDIAWKQMKKDATPATACMSEQRVRAAGESQVRLAASTTMAVQIESDQQTLCDDIEALEILLVAVQAELEFLRSLKIPPPL